MSNTTILGSASAHLCVRCGRRAESWQHRVAKGRGGPTDAATMMTPATLSRPGVRLHRSRRCNVEEDIAASRFWAKVRRDTDTGCWLWTGAISRPSGYGKVRWLGRVESAHFVAFTLSGRRRPVGWHIDHACRRRHCVKPDHLRAVTSLDNSLNSSASNASKQRCKRGHDLTDPSNVYVTKEGWRRCRACFRLHNAGRPSGWERQRMARL